MYSCSGAFKEIKSSKSLEKAEKYLESKGASVMKPFCEYLTAYYCRNKTSIIDVRLVYL